MKLTVKTLMADTPNASGKKYSLETLNKIAENSQYEIKFRKILLFMSAIYDEPLDFKDVVGFVTDCFVQDSRLCFKICLFRPETGYNDLVRTNMVAICPQISGAEVNKDGEVVDINGIHVMNLGTYTLGDVAEYYNDSIQIQED
jgi:hypothetical protein